ncbi:type II toxin-antitoxin system VapC family toxin [Planomonospora sp. ID91781]|uniref:Ribonuclease VapC n=1 Tax=Planomonospora sphaerica TaxID=161355 RepID=A0A161M9V7_9ACTN|nr:MULTISPECIES: type II toxin-antitoxin system VapC family toxin [Planomonospora]MBG0820534.1 type II toxin-antitoxin system VapC family toxin [Planomonospora sp. ID91781]GAT66283.1 toxin VapC4 [Planomonospora sphaerica]
MSPQRALADTSIFIGLEASRFDIERFADYEWGVSAITLGELRLGVLQARDPESAARRLSTYQLAQRFEPLPVDEAVSEAWALLVSRLRVAGRKAPINDSWIAATALAYGIPVVTQDADYDEMPGVEVIRL